MASKSIFLIISDGLYFLDISYFDNSSHLTPSINVSLPPSYAFAPEPVSNISTRFFLKNPSKAGLCINNVLPYNNVFPSPCDDITGFIGFLESGSCPIIVCISIIDSLDKNDILSNAETSL